MARVSITLSLLTDRDAEIIAVLDRKQTKGKGVRNRWMRDALLAYINGYRPAGELHDALARIEKRLLELRVVEQPQAATERKHEQHEEGKEPAEIAAAIEALGAL